MKYELLIMKPKSKPSFWNFVECNGTKYPESPLIFNRSLIETSMDMLSKHHHKNKMNRRNFLGTASCAAVGTTTLFSSILGLGLTNALAGMAKPQPTCTGNYKAMVCILLAGGNDSFNMLVPRNGSHYTEYSNARSTLALSQGSLLPLNYTDANGKQFGVHPSMPEVQTLFNNNRLGFVVARRPDSAMANFYSANAQL